MNYYRHFIGDYLRKTVHLNMLQDGAYRRLMDEYYVTEKPLPKGRELLYARVRANTQEERLAVDEMLKQFFTETKSGFVNKRAKEEIKYANLRAKASKTNGLLGGRPITQQVISRLAKRNLDESSPDSRLQTPDKEKERENLRPAKTAGHIGSPEFSAFWDSYPRKLARREALRAWLKGTCDKLLGEILAGLESWKRCEQWKDPEHVPYPATWLNGRRWEHTPNNGLGASGLEAQRRELERKLGIN